MKLKHKSTLDRRISDILQSENGTSIVFVSIIAIIVITGVVILRVTAGSLWASADKQYSQDKAYLMATSLGESIDALIDDGKIVLDSFEGANQQVIFYEAVSSETVTATVTQSENGYLIEVRADIPNSIYVYRAFYYKSESSNSYLRQLL